jgi:tetratricopeptide (TPR) repeat protein
VLIAGLAAANSFAAADPIAFTLQFLRQRVKSDPEDTVALNRLSVACVVEMRQSGNLDFLDEAAQSARASLKALSAPANPAGLEALAVAEFEQHRFREAISLGQEAYAIDPNGFGALATEGDAELELGEYAKADSIYRTLMEQEPAASICARVARLTELKGDNQKAINLLQEALAEEDKEWYHIRVGEILFRTGQFEAAEHEYDAAQKLAPGHFLVLEHQAELSAARGQFESAIQLYKRVISAVPRPDYYQALGDVYLYMGKPAEAKPWYEKARSGYQKSVKEGNTYFCHHLAGFYCDSLEDPAEALRWARNDMEVRHSVYAYDSLAWAYYKNGDYTKAVDAMTQALSIGTQDAHLLFHASMIFSRAGQLDRGSDFLKQAMAVNPRYNSFHVHR